MDGDVTKNGNVSIEYSLDHNGVVLNVGDGIEALTGYKKDELIGKNFRSFINFSDEIAVFLHFQKAIHGIYEPCEFKVKNKSGQLVLVRSVCHAPNQAGADAVVDGDLSFL